MSWFGVDDRMWRSAKRFRCSTAAMGLWAMAGSWSREERTAGFVPQGALKAIAPDLSEEQAVALAAELVAAKVDGLNEHGLFIPMANGWQFNDWEKYQRETEGEAEKADRIAELRRQAGLRGAQARWQNAAPEDGKPIASMASAIPATRAHLGSGSETDRKTQTDSDPSEPSDLKASAREDGESAPAESAQAGKKSPFKTPAERESFGHWARLVWSKVHQVGEARATPQRVSVFRARLREGAKSADIERACIAVAASPFHFGESDTGKVYIEPKTLFRNREKFEEWLVKGPGKAKAPVLVTAGDRELAERDEALLKQIRAGEWGDQAKRRAEDKSKPIDMRLFREAIKAGKVKRTPREPSGVRPMPPADVSSLLGAVGRPMP